MGHRSGRVAARQLSLCHKLARERFELSFQLRQSALPSDPQALAALQLLPADS